MVAFSFRSQRGPKTRCNRLAPLHAPLLIARFTSAACIRLKADPRVRRRVALLRLRKVRGLPVRRLLTFRDTQAEVGCGNAAEAECPAAVACAQRTEFAEATRRDTDLRKFLGEVDADLDDVCSLEERAQRGVRRSTGEVETEEPGEVGAGELDEADQVLLALCKARPRLRVEPHRRLAVERA